METIELTNGLKMPVVGYGVFQITDEATCIEAVKNAIQVGYRLIDTAQSYGNERAVGLGIKAAGVPRGELFITTKVWISNAGYQKAYDSVKVSLATMQLDYLDLVLIHQPYSDYYGTYRALIQLYQEGYVKAIGVSNFYPDRLVDLALYQSLAPMVNQIEINPFHQQHQAVEINTDYHVKVQAWAPLAEGKQQIFEHPLLTTIGNQYGKSVAQVILRWCLQRQIVPLVKTVHLHRMQENLDIFDFQLSEQDMELIATIDQKNSAFFDHQDPKTVARLAQLVR